MNTGPLPRKRKITLNQVEVPPKAFAVLPQIEKRQVITAFRVDDPMGRLKRANIIEEIQKRYPQVTACQLDDAEIIYHDYYADVKLRQFSPSPKDYEQKRKWKKTPASRKSTAFSGKENL